MAEIKSTLDLVMERTRGLSLTDSEREELRAREIHTKVNSVLERFIAEIQGIKWLKSELDGLGLGANPEIGKVLKSEILARLNINGENGKFFEALEKVLGVETKPYKKLVAEFKKKYKMLREERSKYVLEGLAVRNISGSAVKPNPGSDPGWVEISEKLAGNFLDRVRSV